MKKLLQQHLLFPILILFLSSCNFVQDEANKDLDIYDLSKMNGTCELNTEQFKKILDEDIEKDITCLKNNFNQFYDFVKREEEGVILQNELMRFISRFFPKDRDQINKSIFMLFDLNMILLRDSQGKISRSNFNDLFNIFNSINYHGRILKTILTGDEKLYWTNRQKVNDSIEALTASVLNSMISRGSGGQTIDIIDFIKRVKVASDFSDDKVNIKLIESFLFLKKLLVGGNPKTISTDELESLVRKVPHLTLGVLDIAHSTKEILPSLNMRDRNFLRGINIISNSLYNDLNDTEMIITHSDLIDGLEELEIKDFDIRHVESSLKNFKSKILKTNPEVYTLSDIKTLINWGQEVFETFYFNDYTFDKLQSELEQTGTIENLKRPDYRDLTEVRNERIDLLWLNFEDIIKKFKFFQKENKKQVYTTKIFRTKYGVNNLAILRWGLNKAMDAYGADYKDSDYEINQSKSALISNKKAKIPDLRNLFLDFQTIMEEFELWPAFLERFLGEALYSSDLFQMNSDGDENIDVNEATEYLANVFSSAEYGLDTLEGLSQYCTPTTPYERPEDRTYEVSCFRKHFYKVFFDDLNNKNEYPGLYRYLNSQSQETLDKYLIAVERYAREIFDENIPINKIDMGRIFVSFSNIDALIVRFDSDGSNVIERSELDIVFTIFKKTLITYAKLKPSELKFTHSIFLYLVKYMKVPATNIGGKINLMKFHYFTNKKKINAERLNIGTILAFFVAI